MFLASPPLYNELQKWLNDKIKDAKKEEKLKISLLKYLSRMSTRCTPFALFAGCTIGELRDATKITIGSKKKIEVFFSLDEQKTHDYLPILKVLYKYKNTISSLVEDLIQLNSQKNLEVELENLLSSYIHMTMNRLFKSKNRIHELVCYDFLYRFYKSLHARNK